MRPGSSALQMWSLAVALALMLLVAIPAASAQDIAASGQGDELGQIAASLDDIARELNTLQTTGNIVHPDIERRLQEILTASSRLSAQAAIDLAAVQQQVAALGTPPGSGAPPEPASITAARDAAAKAMADVTSRSHASSFLRLRADQLLQAVAERERTAVFDALLLSTPPPWDPAVWNQAQIELGQVTGWLSASMQGWLHWYWTAGGLTAPLKAAAAVALAAILALTVASQLHHRLVGAAPVERASPGFAAVQRALVAMHATLVPVAALAALLMVLQLQGWFAGAFGAVLRRAGVTAVMVVLSVQMIRVLSGTGRSLSSLLSFRSVRPWPRAGYLLTALAAVTAVAKEAALREATPPLAMIALFAAMVGVLSLLVLAPLLVKSAWPSKGGGLLQRRRPLLRGAVILFAFGPLVMALLGHGVLAAYLFNRSLASFVLLWWLLQLRYLLRDVLVHLLATRSETVGNGPATDDEGSDASTRIASFWACALLDVLILGMATNLVLLLLLDVPQAQLDYWRSLAMGDIEIGGATISLPNIALAAGVLALGLFASSHLRRWLGNRLLAQSGMEIGLRTSIAAASGYVAMILAVVAAIATAGISLSSLAIVAGALSVGIGFGLRTVVENFVAGLLMLIERPIRVGDWVVIGNTEGKVRRIAVRATEIETFDSASVIVPNSMFVASPVTNWTLKNRRARIRIGVGVAYGTEPRTAMNILLDCARAHPAVAAFPAPDALFTELGDSALQFELRCHVRDTESISRTRSELLTTIYQALREHGIDIPYPQQVIHRGGGWPDAGAEQPAAPPLGLRPAS